MAKLDEKARHMPVHQAMKVLRGKAGDLQMMSFIETELLGEQKPKKLRGVQKQLLQQHGQLKTDMQTLAHSGKPRIGKAEKMISDMIQESELKLDAERERCVDFYHTQTDQLDETRSGIQEQQAKSAAARAEKLRAQAEITFIDGKQPLVIQDLKTHNDQCAEDIAGLEGQLEIVNADIETMGLILNMTSCNEEEQTLLLMKQREIKCCKHHNKTKTGVSFLMTTSSPLSKLRSGIAQFLMESEVPVRSVALVPEAASGAVSFEQLDTSASEFYVLQDEHGYTSAQGTSTPSPVAPPMVCPQEAGKKCTIADSPACPRINNKFLKIDKGIKQKKKELERDLMKKRKYCKTETDKMESQIADMDTHRTSEETNVAKATGEINEAETTTNKMQKRFSKLTDEYNDELLGCTVYTENDDIHYEMIKEAGVCANKLSEYEAEICGLKKIRIELAKLQGEDIYLSDVIDCEVTDWIEGDCSAPCGGGTLEKTRTIKVNPNENGAACPPLKITEVCNHLPCPVDCVVDEWQEWSACSASCGTGVKERLRFITTHSAHGGTPCDATNEDESCNMQSCDQDCKLADWCEWTECDKQCGGGTQSRVRHIAEPAQGEGLCDTEHSPKRLQFQPCNTMSCEEVIMGLNDTRPYLECESKLDVILVMDGSGSLGQAGWDASVAAAKQFARAFDTANSEVELAMLLFSGPGNWDDLDTCMGFQRPWFPQFWDDMRDCKMEWVSHYTDDMPSVIDAIDQLSWPSGTTLTAKALEAAEAELANGRDDADTVIVVITDGQPTDDDQVQEIADYLKEKAKLVWVLVGNDVMQYREEVEGWASEPGYEHVIEVHNISALPEPDSINSMIADFCPELE